MKFIFSYIKIFHQLKEKDVESEGIEPSPIEFQSTMRPITPRLLILLEEQHHYLCDPAPLILKVKQVSKVSRMVEAD